MNTIKIFIIIIIFFIIILTLIETFKDKFSEISNKSTIISFDLIKNKKNTHTIKLNNEHYIHYVNDFSKDKKYHRNLKMEKYKLYDKVFIACDLYLIDIEDGDYLYTKHLIEDKNKYNIDNLKYNKKEKISIIESNGKFKKYNMLLHYNDDNNLKYILK